MPSETDLINDALSQIGADVITAIDDGSINANHAQRLYPSRRRALLRSHTWNFAEHRIELQQDVTDPLFEFAFSYTLPADYIRLKRYSGSEPETGDLIRTGIEATPHYKIEGDKLFTNDSKVKIVYVRDITNPNRWDPLFYQALAKWLASEFAHAIAKDDRKGASLLGEFANLMLPLAAAVDSQEQPIVPYQSDELTRGR